MQKRFQSGVVGLRLGGFWGGIIGAIVFGVFAFLDDSAYRWDAARNWVWLFMIFGLIWGLFFGSILGAIIGALQSNRGTGILLGVAIGLLIAIRLISDGGVDAFVFTVIVIWSSLGWIVSNKLQTRERLP